MTDTALVEAVIKQEIYAHKEVAAQIWESVKQANKVQYYKFFDDKTENLIDENIKVHNDSKLESPEFDLHLEALLIQDKSKEGKKRSEDLLKKEFMRHIDENKHHCEYWINKGEKFDTNTPIPHEHLIEMLCGMAADCLMVAEVTRISFEKILRKNVMHKLHPRTQDKLRDFMPLFDVAFKNYKRMREI